MLRRSFSLFLLAAVVCLGAFNRARAENWQATLYEEGSPQRLVGVDKKKGNFLLFEKKSPLKARYSYPCVTGQLAGDKQQVNDLRTPEGIYFVEYKIASGLDFREYGGIAYTLNYPNPVDRLRGKTGHGIWIHSKGFELVPTRGCVAIGLKDIAEVGPSLLPGTPVVLAWELDRNPKSKNETARSLARMMREWSAAWASRSPKLFDFYDQNAYSKATENFAAFRQNKERLFKILNFIKIFNREIHVLEGPGYWVTWAEQFYTASNLSTEGIRRLYWQKDRNNKFRIVGMEWTPRDVGMRADFMQGRLVAENMPSVATDAASEKPLAPRLDMPEMAEGANVPAPLPTQGMQASLKLPDPVAASSEKPAALPAKPASPVKEKKEETTPAMAPRASIMELARSLLLALSDPLTPNRRNDEEPVEITWGEGVQLGKTSSGNAESAAQPPQQLGETASPPDTRPLQPAVDQTPARQAGQAEQPELSRQTVLAAVENWTRSFANREKSIESLYNPRLFNRVKGVPRVQSQAQAIGELRRHFARPWLVVINRPWKVNLHGKIAETSCEQLISSVNGIEEGERKLWWQDDGNGNLSIVGSSFHPRNVGLNADYLEVVSGDVANMLENWRVAWETGNVDNYISFYAANALQQGRLGAQSIRKQKTALWSRARPASVQLSGLRMALDKQGVRVDMAQKYRDINGKGDKGIKTLLLRYDGQRWLIAREEWAAPAQQAKLTMP